MTLGWLVYDMTGNALLVGALQATRAIPFVVVGPISGVLGDRMDRRKLLIANQCFLATLALVLAGLIVTETVQVWHLFAFTALMACGFAMNNPLRQALTANTVPRSELANAVALNSAAFNINRILGPAVGGLLIAFMGPGMNFLVQAVCYLVVAMMAFPMRLEWQDIASKKRASPFSEFREGLRYVVREQKTLALILLAFIPALLIMPFTTGMMPVFAKDVLDEGPGGLGLLLSMFGVGGLCGTLMVATIGSRARSGYLQLIAGVASGGALVAVSLSTSLWMAMVFLAAEGAFQMMYNAINNTTLQTTVPDSLRGRVSSIYLMNQGMVPLGGFFAGSVAHAYGSPLAMLLGGSIGAGCVLLAVLTFKVVLKD